MNTEPITENQLRIQFKIITNQLERLNDVIAVIPDPKIVSTITNWRASLVSEIEDIQKRSELLLKDHEKLGALSGIGRVVNSSLDLSTVLQIVMDTIIRLINAERGFLMLYDESGLLKLRVARNWEQENLEEQEITFSTTLIHQVETNGIPILSTNALRDPRFEKQESVVSFNLRSILCVPLKVKGLLIGVIYTDNRIKAGLFTNRELDLLTGFADQAAVALENAKLFESTQKSLQETTELKQLLDNAFASVTSGILTTDVQQTITYCNKPAERILGVETSNVIGKMLTDGIPCLGGSVEQTVREVTARGEIITDQEVPVRPKGTTISYLNITISPLKNASSKIIGSVVVIEDMTDRKRLEANQRLFERMVSPEIIKQLDPDKLALGGTKKEISVLFADIRAFTRFSEIVQPEELIIILNKYFSLAADILLDYGGTIDKFMGDCILAWFNAPLEQTDHVFRAAHAAVDIQKGIQQLPKNEFDLRMGIGIHSGEAVLGLVGTEKRMEYTAIGDTVNTAKRIQEIAAPGQILTSAKVAKIIEKTFTCESRGSGLLKGKSEPIGIFEVLGTYS